MTLIRMRMVVRIYITVCSVIYASSCSHSIMYATPARNHHSLAFALNVYTPHRHATQAAYPPAHYGTSGRSIYNARYTVLSPSPSTYRYILRPSTYRYILRLFDNGFVPFYLLADFPCDNGTVPEQYIRVFDV